MTGAPGPGTIRVLIADDQRVVREGLSMLVSLVDGVEVVGTAQDGAEAVRLAEAHHPDVILMDLCMPGTDGITATADLRDRLPACRVLVLTTYAEQEAIIPALQAGARGYLTKDAGIAEISRAVHAAADHHALLDPVVQARLIAAAGAGSRPAPAPASLPDDLTPREAEVLSLIARGLSNAEIAATLVVSEATVKTHINHLFAKTGARDRAQAVHYAYTHGLAD